MVLNYLLFIISFLSIYSSAYSFNRNDPPATYRSLDAFEINSLGKEDIAFLFGLPDRGDEFIHHLGFEDRTNHTYSTLSHSDFNQILDDIHKNLKNFDLQIPLRRTGSSYQVDDRHNRTMALIRNFESWRMVSTRFVPCYEPVVGSSTCQSQLRLVFQPIVTVQSSSDDGTSFTPAARLNRKGRMKLGGIEIAKPDAALAKYDRASKFATEDFAIHLVFNLTDEDIDLAMGFVFSMFRMKKAILQGKNRSVFLGVHPLLESGNLHLEPAQTIKSMVMKVARRCTRGNAKANLSHVLFIGAAVNIEGESWMFAKYLVGDKGALEPKKLNFWPTKNFLDMEKITQVEGLRNYLHFNSFELRRVFVHSDWSLPYGKNSILSQKYPNESELEFNEFWADVSKLQNYPHHNMESVDCISCHVSTSSALFRHFLGSGKASFPDCLFVGWQEDLTCTQVMQERVESGLEPDVGILDSSSNSHLTPKLRKYLNDIERYRKRKHIPEFEYLRGHAFAGRYPFVGAFNTRQFGYRYTRPSVSLRTSFTVAEDLEVLRNWAEVKPNNSGEP